MGEIEMILMTMHMKGLERGGSFSPLRERRKEIYPITALQRKCGMRQIQLHRS